MRTEDKMVSSNSDEVAGKIESGAGRKGLHDLVTRQWFSRVEGVTYHPVVVGSIRDIMRSQGIPRSPPL
jgi:hypothetical protein